MPRGADRRTFMGRVLGAAATAGALGAILGGASHAAESDFDSGPAADRPGQGRRPTDCDSQRRSGPRDLPGRGRGGGERPAHVSDYDRYDPVRAACRPATLRANPGAYRPCSDSNPNDSVGRGVECNPGQRPNPRLNPRRP